MAYKSSSVICGIALPIVLCSCASTGLPWLEYSQAMSYQAKHTLDCASSMSDAEKEQIRLHELKPETPFVAVKGDWKQPGPLNFIGSFPANTTIPTHCHNADEVLVIVSGSAYIGMYTGGREG